ncbi:MAG: DEAD/DEAH box helicase [Planctomycetota bacterium]
MLTDRVSDDFNAGVRSRGGAYFRSGRVQLHDFDSEGRIQAIVVGSRRYTVSLEFECGPRSWILYADCTCPYMDSYGDFCKHIWATLLTIEQLKQEDLRRFGPIPRTVSVEFLDDGDDLDDEEDDLDAWNDDANEWDDPDDEHRLTVKERIAEEAERTLAAGTRQPASLAPRARTSKSGGGRPATTRRRDATPAWQALLRQLPMNRVAGFAARRVDDSPIEPIYVFEVEDSLYSNSPVLSLAQQQLTASGKLGKVKKLSLSPDDIARIPDEADRKICLLLLGASAVDGPYTYYGRYAYQSEVASSKWNIPPPLQLELLPMLSATGRFLVRMQRDAALTPLTWDGGEAWELALSIQQLEGSESHVLLGHLRRGDERCALGSVECFVQGSPALFVRDGAVSQFEAHGCFAWLDPLRTRKPTPLRRADLPKLLDELARLGTFPPVEWPSGWDVTEVDDLVPQAELSLRIENANSFGRNYPARGEVKFRYADSEIDAVVPGRMLVDANGLRLIRRQTEVEHQMLNRLLELGAREDRYNGGFEVHPRKLPVLVSTLITEGWVVLGNHKLYRSPGEFRINVNSGIDWFDVDGQVDFDGQAARLPELLAALDKGERFVTLGDGSFGMLPEDWLTRHRGWLELGRAEDGRVRFSNTQIGLIDALLAEMPEATFDANLAAARKKLARFAGVKPRKEPAGFRGALRPYQREGLGWLRFLDDFDWGGCLADDMGLGKTVQLLAHLADRRRQGKHGPSLVVAPKSVIFNWARAAERFTPRVRVLNYTGLERKQSRDALGGHDLVLTTYGTLRRDIKFLREQRFNYVVLDEAQAIKNPTSQGAKATRLLQARRRLALTGTPVENDLGDLWSISEFLNPGMLGTVRAFKNFASIGRNEDNDRGQLPLLQRMMRPFVLRRTKEQVAPELPQRSEQTIHCELPTKQAAYYKELRDHYRTSLLARVDEVGLARSKMHVLEALLRLRQAACHPGLIDESKIGAESAKLEALLAMVAELIEEGHKALIFSQFTKMLAIVRGALDQRGVTYEYLDGKTRDRVRRVDRFQNDPECPLFLISLKAGGTGLNLTAADYVLILDPWWNPAVEAQAIDRAHRIGQNKKVIAYRLIARNTVESKILDLQQSKRELAEAIITQQNSVIRTLTREDLAGLLA